MSEIDSPAPAETAEALLNARATAKLVLADGTVFEGRGFGAATEAVGEVCFNTAMTGYQEILTDPSYTGQIVAFTFPHIGIVGTNLEDIEALTPAVRAVIVRADAEDPSNYRSLAALDRWLALNDIPGIAGIDTRADITHPREGHAARHRGACAGRQVRHGGADNGRARISRPRRARSREGC